MAQPINKAKSRRLATGLRRLLKGFRFDRIRDFGPEEDVFPAGGAQPLNQVPYLDLAVIAFDRNREPVAVANALLSPALPRGWW